MKRVSTKFYVYILRTSADTLYTGQTNNLKKRLAEHASHGPKSAKYLRRFQNITLVYSEKCSTRKEAMQRESAIKKLKRVQKDKLIVSQKSTNKALV